MDLSRKERREGGGNLSHQGVNRYVIKSGIERVTVGHTVTESPIGTGLLSSLLETGLKTVLLHNIFARNVVVANHKTS